MKNNKCSRSDVTLQHLCKLRHDSRQCTKKSRMRRLFPLNPVISMASVSPQLYAFLKWKNKTRMSLPKFNVILQRAQICENIWFVPLIWLFQAKRNVLVIKIIVKVSHNLKQFQSVSVCHLFSTCSICTCIFQDVIWHFDLCSRWGSRSRPTYRTSEEKKWKGDGLMSPDWEALAVGTK